MELPPQAPRGGGFKSCAASSGRVPQVGPSMAHSTMVRSVKSTSEEVPMRELTAAAFAGRLHEMLEVPDCKLVWFLGAGCSISSGVPGAAALVNSWLPRLKTRETGSDDDWQTWATTKFPEFDPDNAAKSYGAVMDELFPLSYERQQEVERITSNCDPAIGYALFSVLAAHEEHGPKSNIVLTTNFDDLIADSLYLLTRKKPLVVAHESLAAFVRASRRRPLIVKVHGDARLAPRNTADETRELESELVARVTSLMSGSGLIFSGYAGNDVSISRLLNDVPDDSFPLGIYWIGMTVPDGPVGDWLRTRPESFHVKHHDFDELMMQIAERIDLSLPGIDRFRDLFDGWAKALHRTEVSAGAGTEPDVGRAASRLRRDLGGLRAAARAEELATTDPEAALLAFEEAIADEPAQAIVYSAFAAFLARSRKDFDRAETMYERAIAADPEHANNLGNYALFLARDRKDFDRAGTMFESAIAADPEDANSLGNYALFLARDRKDFDRAGAMYESAIAADPEDANNLGNYAQLLFARGDEARATPLAQMLLKRKDLPPALRVELLYYRVADGRDADSAGPALRSSIDAGERSKGWDLSMNVDRAAALEDGRLAFLRQLAAVVADEVPAETLDDFETWKSWRKRS